MDARTSLLGVVVVECRLAVYQRKGRSPSIIAVGAGVGLISSLQTKGISNRLEALNR